VLAVGSTVGEGFKLLVYFFVAGTSFMISPKQKPGII